MKLFLIKIGKAINTIKRDGLIGGGRRIVGYLAVFLKTIFQFKSGDVLFITGGVGDSSHYRSYTHAEELESHGFKCMVMLQDNPLLPKFADRYKIFIFQKVLHTPIVEKLIKKIKAQNKEIIFETDDLVFEKKFLEHMDHYKNMQYFEKKQYENGVGGEILNDPYVKVCTTTTSFLADKLREYGKKVFIVPNKISNKELEITEKIIREPENNGQKPLKIGYFSGTISHNKDFATITGALMKILEKHPDVELYLVGPLDIDNVLNKFKARVKQFPMVSREKHYHNVAGVDINLAPLEIGNPYCESKSELKFFEAGILEVPTVAAATQTFREAIMDGVDGFLAGNTEEWTDKLEKLITDENLRKTMGKKAREKALQNYTVKNSNNDEYYNFLRSKL